MNEHGLGAAPSQRTNTDPEPCLLKERRGNIAKHKGAGFSSLFRALSQNITGGNPQPQESRACSCTAALLITHVVLMGTETPLPSLKPQAHFPSSVTSKRWLWTPVIPAHSWPVLQALAEKGESARVGAMAYGPATFPFLKGIAGRLGFQKHSVRVSAP